LPEPVRILLIAPSMNIVGGQSIQASQLLARLGREPELQVEFQAIDCPLPRALAWTGRIRYLRTAVRFALYLLALWRRLRRGQVVHIFSAGKSSYLLWSVPTLLASKLARARIVLHYHDGRIEEHLRWRTARPTLRRFDRIVAPSDYLVEVFARHGIRSERIYNVVDNPPFIFRARTRLRPVLLTNRGLEPEYNVGCTLRAFAIVQREHPEATLTVAHDGSLRSALERLAGELGLRNVRFTGSIPYSGMPQLYEEADIYVATPDVDAMPGSLLECFASGIPVVSTNAGGIPHIVEHERTGLLAEKNDHEGVAAAILRLLRDPALVEWITSNARRELLKYGWPELRGHWLRIYHELASNS
jgi:glycosyltransferase involved in cell wall biosynthesis